MDRRITGEMNYLAKKGHRVVFLSPPVNLEGSGIFEGIACPGQGTGPFRQAKVGAGRSAIKRIRECVMLLPSFLAVPLCAVLFYVMDLAMYRSLYRTLKRELPDFAPDCIHIHDLRLAEFGIWLRKNYPHARLIYDSHELTPFQCSNRKVSSYILWRERRVVRAMDAVITVNESIAERMQELYGVKKPYVLFNSQESLESANTFGTLEGAFGIPRLPDDAVKVLFQGSLSLDRNIENLLEAFRILPNRFYLFVLGTGELGNFAREFGSPQVFYHEAVPQTMLHSVTCNASFGIIPYLGDSCENTLLCTPNKLFEFINARIPVCSSMLPEVRRILGECGNGLCYKMNTPEEIADAISSFESEIERGTFTPEALKQAAEMYSFERQITVLDKVYV